MATCSENVDSQTWKNVSRIYIFTTAFGVVIDCIKVACLRLGKDPAVPPLCEMARVAFVDWPKALLHSHRNAFSSRFYDPTLL
jgi:hypothetical protein